MLEDLFQPLIGSLPFDDILLASDSGDIVYQSKKNAPQFTTLAALLENQTGGAVEKKLGRARHGKGRAARGRAPTRR